MNNEQVQRITELLSEKAGEVITAERHGKGLILFCESELGMYRVINYYKSIFNDLMYGHSASLRGWYVSYELKI